MSALNGRRARGDAAGLAGPLLAVTGGALVACGTLLPWVEIEYLLPRGAHGTYLWRGFQLPPGQLALGLAALTVVVGLITVRTGSGRGLGTLWVALAAALVLALVGDQVRAGGAGWGVIVAALGAVVELAAVPLGWPGGRRQGLWLLAGTALLAVIAFAVVELVAQTSRPTF